MIQVCGSLQTSRIAPFSLVAPVMLSMNKTAHERGDHDQRDVDPDHHLRVVNALGGQHPEADQLDRGHTEVAARRVEAERPALEPGRVEVVDVGHRGGEVATADAGECAEEDQRVEAGVAHEDLRVRRDRVTRAQHQREHDGRHQQQAGRDDGPVATAELGHREGVGQAQHGTDGGRHRDQQELVCGHRGGGVPGALGLKPYFGPRNRIRVDHIVQTEKPMCSEKIENQRLRWATLEPFSAQNFGSSGSQSSIQCGRDAACPDAAAAPLLPATFIASVSVGAAVMYVSRGAAPKAGLNTPRCSPCRVARQCADC